jgi:hypothetical protein
MNSTGKIPAFNDIALAPFMPSELVTLSPLQLLAAYCIVPAVALLVNTKGRTADSTLFSASCDDLDISSVYKARP